MVALENWETPPANKDAIADVQQIFDAVVDCERPTLASSVNLRGNPPGKPRQATFAKKAMSTVSTSLPSATAVWSNWLL
ncbi:hypothetical protein OKW46_001152 [Paraburkholderia sp. WSM4179]|nr:hypothetical protein [Paraburkholderia sp. WSM4179]